MKSCTSVHRQQYKEFKLPKSILLKTTKFLKKSLGEKDAALGMVNDSRNTWKRKGETKEINTKTKRGNVTKFP